MKKNEKSNLFEVITSIIIGIIIIVVINLNSTATKIAFTQPELTQNEYDLLKEYALQVAKGEYSGEDENVKVERKIEEENLKIKIETSRMYGIEAKFPISTVVDLAIENGIVKYEASIDYKNATYSEYTFIMTKFEVIVIGVLLASIASVCVYVTIFWGPKEFKRVNKKYNEEKC